MGELIPSGTTVDQINKAQGLGLRVKPPEAPEYTGEIYRTTIRNNSGGEVRVLTDKGMEWFWLHPGKEITLTSWSPHTRLAPFSKLVYEKDGRLTTTRRWGFRDPAEDAPYSILLDNRDGGESESIRIGDEYVEAHRGLPRRVEVRTLGDPMIAYKSVIWRKRTVKEPAPGHRDYLITRTIVEKVLVPRKASELRAIKREMEKAAVAEARRSAAKRFKGVVGGPETDDAETETPAD